MALSECINGEEPSGMPVTSNEGGRCGHDALEGLMDQLSDVIYGLAIHRPDPSDGAAWNAFDAALCGLHSALIALDELGGVHEMDGVDGSAANCP